jgi:hypothetical protein
LVRIGPTAWPFTGFIHTYIHTDRQLDKYILDAKILIYGMTQHYFLINFVNFSVSKFEVFVKNIKKLINFSIYIDHFFRHSVIFMLQRQQWSLWRVSGPVRSSSRYLSCLAI